MTSLTFKCKIKHKGTTHYLSISQFFIIIFLWLESYNIQNRMYNTSIYQGNYMKISMGHFLYYIYQTLQKNNIGRYDKRFGLS